MIDGIPIECIAQASPNQSSGGPDDSTKSPITQYPRKKLAHTLACQLVVIVAASGTLVVSGPETRMMPTPARPGAVASAKIVSARWLEKNLPTQVPRSMLSFYRKIGQFYWSSLADIFTRGHHYRQSISRSRSRPRPQALAPMQCGNEQHRVPGLQLVL